MSKFTLSLLKKEKQSKLILLDNKLNIDLFVRKTNNCL